MEQNEYNNPEYSHSHTQNSRGAQTKIENDNISVTSREIKTHKLDIGLPISLGDSENNITIINPPQVIDNHHMAEVTKNYIPELNSQRSVIYQPLTIPALHISSNLPSPISVNIPLPNQPQSLFLMALSKLNESSLSLAIGSRSNINQLTSLSQNFHKNSKNYIKPDSPELTPPGSLTSAPPSYSFVLRQMAVRRRPRLLGTFFPSPSFVQHTPPPNYATAFDIYVDNPVPPPPTRVYHFGFTSMPIMCPECGHTGMTIVTSKITLCTHLCALVLCLLCCWICAPLPYLLRSCKDVYHYCRNCRNFLGMYCPTNPENAYS